MTKETGTKTLNIDNGKKVTFNFDEDQKEEPLPEELETLIKKLYKPSKDINGNAIKDKDENEINPTLLEARKTYNKLFSIEGSTISDVWANQLKIKLQEQDRLATERVNVFEHGKAANALKGGAPTISLAGVEGGVDPRFFVSDDTELKNPSTHSSGFRELLKQDPKSLTDKIFANKNLDEVLKVIEATKTDIAVNQNLNHARIAILLSGQILTAEKLVAAAEWTAPKEDGAFKKVAASTTEAMFKGQDPAEIGGIYQEVHGSLNKRILSNMALHPDLSDPFYEKIKANKRNGVGNKYEEGLLEASSKAEDEAHAAERKALDTKLQEKNKEFYASLEKVSKDQHEAIPKTLMRLLIMANPFMGGMLLGSWFLGPLVDVLQGAASLNDFVLSPIKFAGEVGGEVLNWIGGGVEHIPEIGKPFVEGLKCGIEQTGNGLKIVGNKIGETHGFKEVGQVMKAIIDTPSEVVGIFTQNSTAEAIFGSAAPALKGPIMQIALAGLALCYETDKRTDLSAAKSKVKDDGKTKFSAVFDGFNDALLKRRGDDIEKFAKENAVKIKETEYLGNSKKLEPEISTLLNGSGDKANLAKVIKDKLNLKDLKPQDLEKTLRENIFNPEIQTLLLAVKNAKGIDGGIDKLRAAFEATTTYDNYLRGNKTGIDAEKDKMVFSGLYKLNPNLTGEDKDKALKSARDKVAADYLKELEPYLNYALKNKDKSVEAEDTVSVKPGDRKTADSVNLDASKKITATGGVRIEKAEGELSATGAVRIEKAEGELSATGGVKIEKTAAEKAIAKVLAGGDLEGVIKSSNTSEKPGEKDGEKTPPKGKNQSGGGIAL